MHNYRLFVARDGEAFMDTICARDEGEARAVATRLIVAAFDLDSLLSRNFEEAVAETDGVILDGTYSASVA